MSLICILLGLILQHSVDSLHSLRNFDWFKSYSQWILKHLPGLSNQGSSSIVILLLPILLVTGLLQHWFHGAFFNVFSLIFGLAVFVFCLGPGDLNRDIDAYLEARESGDEENAQRYASAIIDREASTSPDQQTADVMQGILHLSNDRIFAVIFWFALLGPLGALMFRLTSYTMYHITNKTLADAAKNLQALMAWAPAHLVAWGYALTGNYEGATASYRGKVKQDDLSSCNYYTLITAGMGALKDCAPGEETACIRATRGLVLRTLVVWLAVIGMLTLIGWIS